MTTDTKAVARWDWDDLSMITDSEGDFIRFTDYEHMVGELTKELDHAYAGLESKAGWEWKSDYEAYKFEAETLRAALAASRAEVEGLRAELGLVLEWATIEKKPLRSQEIESIRRVLEKGNV